MNGILERSLAILELLAAHPEGIALAVLADRLAIPRSAVHRLLNDLTRLGYVRQLRDFGDYALTTRLVALGLNFLYSSGIVDIAQPALDRLAELSGELVRLAVLDGERLTFVARAQGARKGLRYDPDMGMDARLSCTATGHAWLLTLDDETALQAVARQGFGKPADYGPAAPTTVGALLDALHLARERGWAGVSESAAPGMAALAAPVRNAGAPAIGVIVIAGPALRLTPERMTALAPDLLAVAAELAVASGASRLFHKPPA